MNPLARLAFPALRWRRRTGFALERRRIDETLRLGVGGYVLFGGTGAAVRELVAGINAASPHPLLIASDFERGAAQQISDLTHLPPPAALGFIDRPEITARCGAVTAREARHVGVNWVYAPVADLDLEPENPIIGTRSFGDQPEMVGRHVETWVRAAEQAGVVTSAKHYPGHGRTAADSHATLPTVDLPYDQLAASDLAPFRSAIAAGTRSVMTAHVSYPAWDPSGLPATLSPLLMRHLREGLGFQGLVVTDALIMEGVLQGAGEAKASVRAIAAGADALLYPVNAAAVVGALEREVGSTVPRARVDDALERVARAAEGVRTPVASLVDADLAAHRAFATATADLALHMLRGEQLSLYPPLDVQIVDDDVGGPYTVGPRDLFHAKLRDAAVTVGPGGSKVVLVYAEPRSWKGRASLGERSLRALEQHRGAALIVLFGHPRLVGQLPGDLPVLCAWHGQPLLQEAAARWVAARLR